jgi:hypothetical protein
MAHAFRLRSSLRPIISCVTSSSFVFAVFQRAAVLAVAQHRDPVGDLEDLFHPVRNVDDADAVGLEVLDHVEQHHLLGIGQRGGRFIEDHGLGVDRQRAGDLDHLLVGDGQVADQRAGIEADLQLLQDRVGLGE